MSIKLKKSSRIILRSGIRINKERNYYVVGRRIGVSIRTTEDGVHLLKLLGKNISLREVYMQVKDIYTYSAVKGFVSTLINEGFVESIDGERIPDLHHAKRQLPFITRKRVKWMFSKEFLIFYWFIVAFALFLLAFNRALMPSWSAFFITNTYSVDIVISFFVAILLVSLHELAHMCAARSLNLDPVIGLSNRFNYLVATTNIDAVWTLPRRKRYRIFLSGMMMDMFLAGLSIIFLWMSFNDFLLLPILIVYLLKFVILAEFLSIAWQFMFFFKTDVYYALENLFQTNNLANNMKSLFKQIFKKRKPVFFSKRDKKFTIIYAGITFLGIGVNIYVFFKYQLVIMIEILMRMIKSFFMLTPKLYPDSLMLFVILLINQYLFNKGFFRHHKLGEKRFARMFFKVVNTIIILLVILLLAALVSLI